MTSEFKKKSYNAWHWHHAYEENYGACTCMCNTLSVFDETCGKERHLKTQHVLA
jgi:hypothetical protein